MTGSLLQLVAIGNEDMYITGNPQISFFKAAYKRYTNFAYENINVNFNGSSNLNERTPIKIYATLPKYGDLISNINFEIDIPEIYTVKSFSWISNLGIQIINYVRIYIGDRLIEELDADYIITYYKATLGNEKHGILDKMIGNTPDMVRSLTDITSPLYKGSSKNSSDTNKFGIPSSPYKRLSIPIPFWFSKYSGLEIPLISLFNTPVKIEIELKSKNQLFYLIKDIKPDLSDITEIQSLSNWNLKPILDVKYIYLSNEEKQLIKNYEHYYLIERLQKKEFLGNIGQQILSLEFFNPIKVMYIIPKKNTADEINDFSNYTDESTNIIKNLEIKFNGSVRLGMKDYDYFNKIQPYIHHTNKLPEGVLMYSFSINPEEYQPSGWCNFTNFRKIELDVQYKDPSSDYKYNTSVYCVSYNILKIEKGECNLLFAT